MKLSAPAKVNLSLRVLRKRTDGYHDVESLMAPLSLCDTVEIDLHPGAENFSLTCSDLTLPSDASNLAIIAAREFSSATGVPVGGQIYLDKVIPHGAGLGGGSSDAAAVIRGLNVLTGLHLCSEKLEEIAAGVGSDVPFFIRGGAAWVRGRGERIEPCELPRQFFLVLIKPPFGVSTAWAYAAWANSKNGVDTPLSTVFGGVQWMNDLEVPVFRKFLLLPVLNQWLNEQPETCIARMAGSGSTVFAACSTLADAESLSVRATAYLGKTFKIFTASTIS
jgi:4-diphosphocytidyl-2-C-methyl-D-erythritol kinase